MEQIEMPSSSLAMPPSIFCGPYFGDESPLMCSTKDASPTPSQASTTKPMHEGVSNDDQLSTATRTAANSASNAPSSTSHEIETSSDSSTAQAHTNIASNSLNSSQSEMCPNNDIMQRPTEESLITSALSLLDVENDDNLRNSDSAEETLLPNLFSSSPIRNVLIFSPVFSSQHASTTIKPTFVEEALLEDSDRSSKDHDYPVMGLSSFGTQVLSASHSSQCLTPSTPRPASVMLPESKSTVYPSATGPLVSMHKLVSHDQIVALTLEDNDEDYNEGPSSSESIIPSSSPQDGTAISSSPNSSPSQIFSSSPVLRPMVAHNRKSPLSSILKHDTDNVHSCLPVRQWNPALPSSSPPTQLSSSPVQEQSFYNTENCPQPILSNSFALDGLADPNSVSDTVYLPMSSSPIPPSSPSCITASSSPVSSQNHPPLAFSSPPKKRKRDDEDKGRRSVPGSPSEPKKHPLRALLLPPAPKRQTPASQRRQHQKLITPFKCPLIMKTEKGDMPMGPPNSSNSAATSHAFSKPPTSAPLTPNEPSAVESKKKFFTSRATAQFKSPLSSAGSAVSSRLLSEVRLTPTTQALERKIQILRRAVKVKKNLEEEVLNDLMTRWTEAGREAAWEVWELVKNSGVSSSGSWGRSIGDKRPFKESWGWESQPDEKRIKPEESWEWNTSNGTDEAMRHPELRKEEEEEETTEYTLGSMLRGFGIDPATLGWDDQEGSFRDP